MTQTTKTIRYNQTGKTGEILPAGDVAAISFSDDGEDLYFTLYIDCDGIAFREVITRDGRYQYVFGKQAEGEPSLATQRGDGASYRQVFETQKGKAQILFEFADDSVGEALTITHLLPECAPLSRNFVREEILTTARKAA